MVWSSLEDVPPLVRKHQGNTLTLAQANSWARQFDALIRTGLDKSRSAAIAWKGFRMKFRRQGDGWVKRSRPLEAMWIGGKLELVIHGRRHDDPTQTRNLRDQYARRLRARVNRAISAVLKLFPTGMVIFAQQEPLPVVIDTLFIQINTVIQTNLMGGVESVIEEETDIVIARAARVATRRFIQEARVTDETAAAFQIAFGQPISPEVRDNLILSQAGFFTKLRDEMSSKIFATLREGIAAGETIPELRRRIQDATNFAASRAEAIARTETVRVFNEAALGRFKQHGVQEKEWLTAGDERVDPDICQPLEGERFPIDSGPANPAHTRCRCSWLPVIPGG